MTATLYFFMGAKGEREMGAGREVAVTPPV
jgi:hypothetical protein